MATAMKPVNGARNETRSRQASQDEGSRLLDGPDDDGVGGGSGGGGGSSCGGGCGGFCERLKPKVSLCLGTTAALSFVAFLFLVPFVVDPAVSRLIARYSPEPGTCALHEHVFAAGLKQCTWSSCREGCTSAITRCHQLTVDYSLTPYQRYVQDGLSVESLQWAGKAVRFLVNTEGCGYPPFVNCTVFALKYGRVLADDIDRLQAIGQPEICELYRRGDGDAGGTGSGNGGTGSGDGGTGSGDDDTGSSDDGTDSGADSTVPVKEAAPRAALNVFPCYYSRAYPDRVVAEYDWHHTVKTLVAAVVVPWTLFLVSCAVLCYWYCPVLKREFMMDRRRTAAVKGGDPQPAVIRRKLSKRPFSTDEQVDDGDY